MSKLIIQTGAQSGVDTGAAMAAIAAGRELTGYMPSDGMTESGPIPAVIAQHLRYCRVPGRHARTKANIETSDMLLCVVQDAQQPYATSGTRLTLELRRELRQTMPYWVVDLAYDAAQLASRIVERARHSRLRRLLVAGPRESLWPEGEAVAFGFVTVILEADR